MAPLWEQTQKESTKRPKTSELNVFSKFCRLCRRVGRKQILFLGETKSLFIKLHWWHLENCASSHLPGHLLDSDSPKCKCWHITHCFPRSPQELFKISKKQWKEELQGIYCGLYFLVTQCGRCTPGLTEVFILYQIVFFTVKRHVMSFWGFFF